MLNMLKTGLVALSFISATVGFNLILPYQAHAAEGVFRGEAVHTLGYDGGINISPGRIHGTGTVVFSNPMSSLGWSSSHYIQFYLQDGGSLTMASYGDSALNSSYNLKFERSGTSLRVLAISWVTGMATDISHRFTNYNAAGWLTFQVDVHAHENPVHLMVWDGNTGHHAEWNTVVNSESDFASPGGAHGGLYRGFILENAHLNVASAGSAKVHHHH